MSSSDIWDLSPYGNSKADLRGNKITVCICGGIVWNIKTIFEPDTGEINLIFTTMECIICGSIADLPDEAIPK